MRKQARLKKQREKALYTYPALFVLVFVYHAFSLSLLKYLISVFLLAVPFLLQEKINLKFRMKDIAAGIIASFIVLAPFWFFASSTGRVFTLLPVTAVVNQLIGISLPEEVYFRGFLQERLGNTIRGLLFTSFLFALVHVPQFIFYRDPYVLLTFFPSLVMGFLYWRTSNILPSVIFHFLSNILFLGLYDILKKLVP